MQKLIRSTELDPWILNKHQTVWFTRNVGVNVNIRFKIQGSIHNWRFIRRELLCEQFAKQWVVLY